MTYTTMTVRSTVPITQVFSFALCTSVSTKFVNGVEHGQYVFDRCFFEDRIVACAGHVSAAGLHDFQDFTRCLTDAVGRFTASRVRPRRTINVSYYHESTPLWCVADAPYWTGLLASYPGAHNIWDLSLFRARCGSILAKHILVVNNPNQKGPLFFQSPS